MTNGERIDLRGSLRASEAVRDGVRLGIRDALARDVDRTSNRTVRRLALAGALGLSSAAAAVGLFARGSPDRADPMHLALCAAAWSSVLVIAFASSLLRFHWPRQTVITPNTSGGASATAAKWVRVAPR